MKKRIIINKFIYFPQKITLFYIILKISTLTRKIIKINKNYVFFIPFD
jgi:hypothetical protein